MRVIAGTAKHLKLKTVEGMNTRPTTDRIKETLFNMISFQVERCRFLDLFSGSGAIGIEALSRGAREAVFVEQNRKAASCIRDNLEHTHLRERAAVMEQDVMAALKRLDKKGEAFSIIFMDPPYGKLLEKKALLFLSDSTLCDEETTIIVEADLKTDFSYLEETEFRIVRQKKYKTNQHIFIEKERSLDA
ncbi:MAG: 16S rRNA (guanine(966)-N(2))-methyltransferase RsmD [Clostridiales bacterium]|nr:16S rRNA (guanine(966)-N(2))-methyltransferase RsmD [Clostridiales bacterium]